MLTLAETGEIVIVGGITIAIIAIVSSATVNIIKTNARERSRREIAAYIAEGTMTPEQGERLLRAEPAESE